MKKKFQYNDYNEKEENGKDVLTLLKDIKRQIGFLEKKIDRLMDKSPERHFEKRHFSKPHRQSSNQYDHYGNKRHDNPFSERNIHPRNDYGDRKRQKGRGSSGGKRPFYSKFTRSE